MANRRALRLTVSVLLCLCLSNVAFANKGHKAKVTVTTTTACDPPPVVTADPCYSPPPPTPCTPDAPDAPCIPDPAPPKPCTPWAPHRPKKPAHPVVVADPKPPRPEKPCHPEEPCSPDAPCASPPPPLCDPPCKKSLWELVIRTPQLSIFAELCEFLGLDVILKSRDFKATIFAPVNLAFETSCHEMGVTLKELRHDRKKLLAYLRYHIVPGVKVTRAHIVPNLPPLATLLCSECFLDASLFWSRFIVEGELSSARVIQCDIMDCGVIHLVDRLLIPDYVKHTCAPPPVHCDAPPPPCEDPLPAPCAPGPVCPSTLSYLSSIPDFSYFVRAIYAVPALSAVLATPSVHFTIFAPTNKAITLYTKSLATDLDAWLANPAAVANFVYAHILVAPYTADMFDGGLLLTTYDNRTIYSTTIHNQLFLHDTLGNLLCPAIPLVDTFICNSVVHVLAFPISWPIQGLKPGTPSNTTIYTAWNSVLQALEKVPEASFFLTYCKLTPTCLAQISTTNVAGTWFIPVDSVWKSFFAAAGLSEPLLRSNPTKRANLLAHHFIEGQFLPTFIPVNGQVYTSKFAKALSWIQPPAQTTAFNATYHPAISRIVSVGYNNATIINGNNVGGQAIYHLVNAVLNQAY